MTFGHSYDAQTARNNPHVVETKHVHVLEMEGQHFWGSCPLLLPGEETGIEPARPPAAGGPKPDPGTRKHVTGLTLVADIISFSDKHPDHKMILAGHGPTVMLSQSRAMSVYRVLLGKATHWSSSAQVWADSHADAAPEVTKRILLWIANCFSWDCAVEDAGAQPQALAQAVRTFQEIFNDEEKRHVAPPGKGGFAGESGVVGRYTWKAFFEMYMAGLAKHLGI